MIVRNEKETDHRHVEELIRKAFYNLYVPGCTEHYLARVMRGHEDFIPELDLVLELDGRVIGSILYTKAKLSDAAGKEKEILTFGPVCIAPEYQRMGYAKEAVKGILEYAAEELEASRVILRIHTENQPSRNFAEQMGFHLSTQRLEKEPDVRLYVYDL